MIKNIEDYKIAIIGLGYVGLPLLVEFSKKYQVTGFDIDKDRINELKQNFDRTNEITEKQLSLVNTNLTYTYRNDELKDSNIYIITVPTPVDKNNTPDLTPIISASKIVGNVLKKNNIVIYESTVYPGCTEELCVPVLQEFSKLTYNKEFFCGYSPERINPGDKEHRLKDIKKITSGSTPEISLLIDDLYKSIIEAGTFLSSSIKVAEAAKVIENTQRDVNIALINELALIFNKLNIDTGEVLDAASTKWNFISLKPGLVGGHCIGVDPYYLTYKSKNVGFKPNVILAGRKINDGMSNYILNNIIKIYKEKHIDLVKSRILFVGCSFKENVTDTRNSKSIELIKKLHKLNTKVDILDQLVNENKIFDIKVFKSFKTLNQKYYDTIIFSVIHDKSRDTLKKNYRKYLKTKRSIIIDINSFLPKQKSDFRL